MKNPISYPNPQERNADRIAERWVEKILQQDRKQTNLILEVEKAVKEYETKALDLGFKPSEIEPYALNLRTALRTALGLPPAKMEGAP